MGHRLTKWLAPLVALTLLAGACGGDDEEEQAIDNPQQAFEAALDALAEYEGVEFVFTLQSTPEDLAAMDEGDEAMPADIAEKVLNSSITIASKGTTPEDAQAEIVLNLDGNEDAVELRVVDQALFARADVRELVEAFGGDVSQVDAAAESGAAAGLDFLAPAINGEWLGIADADQLAEQLGGASPLDSADAKKVGEQLTAILSDNASVTSEGTDDVGAHLSVEVPLRKTVEEFLNVLQQFGGLPTGGALPDTSDLPGGDLTVDAWVSDGRLVQLELDFLKLGGLIGEEVPEGVDRFALRVGLEEFTEGVEAPEDAIMIDPQKIFELFFGGFGAPTDF